MGQDNVFFDILDRKNAFLVYKIKTSSNDRKIDILPKGLTHAIGPKMANFLPFFLKEYRPGKCLLRYSGTKKRLSRL